MHGTCFHSKVASACLDAIPEQGAGTHESNRWLAIKSINASRGLIEKDYRKNGRIITNSNRWLFDQKACADESPVNCRNPLELAPTSPGLVFPSRPVILS
jgi:hypothetical protein